MGTLNSMGSLRWLSLVAVTAAVVSADQVPAQAEDKLLSETVEFTGTVLFLETGVPGLVLGATEMESSRSLASARPPKARGRRRTATHSCASDQ